MSSTAIARLQRELLDFGKQESAPSIFAMPYDDDDIMHWCACVVGPPETPYSLGCFGFDIQFPQDYPNSAPRVLITTTDGGKLRFNPNLYASGKVCLSTLGTWRAENSGEQWSSVQSTSSVLYSIQSLMNDKPYHNEPSFEQDDGSGDVQRYSEKILHENIRLAVCGAMEDIMTGSRTRSPNQMFKHVSKTLFMMHYDQYIHTVESCQSGSSTQHDGKHFKQMPFEYPQNEMRGYFQWAALKQRLQNLHAAVWEETDKWRLIGKEQTKLDEEHKTSALSGCIGRLQDEYSGLNNDSLTGASVGPQSDNMFVWEATIFGPDETAWEGGMFNLEFIFSLDYPDVPPRVQFITEMFHPHVSREGIPHLPCLLLWQYLQPKDRSIRHIVMCIQRLLVNQPDPHPQSHLNIEAAGMYFSREQDHKRDYNRRVRRCVQRSLDM